MVVPLPGHVFLGMYLNGGLSCIPLPIMEFPWVHLTMPISIGSGSLAVVPSACMSSDRVPALVRVLSMASKFAAFVIRSVNFSIPSSDSIRRLFMLVDIRPCINLSFTIV